MEGVMEEDGGEMSAAALPGSSLRWKGCAGDEGKEENEGGVRMRI